MTMIDIRVIKTEKDYREALDYIEALMAADPDPESDEGEKLSILSTLVADYESKTFPEKLPDPIEAIQFRMEQAGLKPADLIPYIGSRSRVSEILSGKRKLTLDMIRSLEGGLGIPAKVLLKEPQIDEDLIFNNWSFKLLKEMGRRGYFGSKHIASNNGNDLLKNFFSTIGSPLQFQALLRQSSSYRTAPSTDKYALIAWAGRIMEKAKKVKPSVKYQSGTVNLSFMQKLSSLSLKENSPIVIQAYLKKHGIILVVEPHFAKTHLDGATLLMNEDNPIIGLTIRHDRLDNFWFTLMHELAHIALHYNQAIHLFYDELEDIKGIDFGTKENEADQLAGEALVPTSKWEVSPARLIPSSMAAESLAKELGVHVAIVAGKIRHEGGKYFYLNNIVSQAKVRQYFSEERWGKE